LPDNKEKSIINIIQNMLASGESADKILSTLKETGINNEQAKTLLMMAQTNSFAVLKGDISKMVDENLAKNYPEIEKRLINLINSKSDSAKKEILDNILTTVKKEESSYQANQKKMVDKIINISVEQDTKIGRIKNKLNELGANYDKLSLGSTKSILYMRIAAFVVGIILTIILVIKFIGLAPGYSIDYLIFFAVFGLLAAVLLVLSLI